VNVAEDLDVAAVRRDGDAEPASKRRLRRLRDWPVRGRIVALIAVPTVLAVALGAVGVTEAVRSATADQRAHTLAELSSSVTALVGDLEGEQAASAVYVASRRAPAAAGRLQSAYRRVDATVGPVRAAVDDVRGAYPAATRQRARTARFRLDELPDLHRVVRNTRIPARVTTTKYSDVIGDLLAMEGTIASESGDPQLTGSVRALHAVSRVKAELAVQRSLVGAALAAGRFPRGDLVALRDAVAAQQGAFAEFQSAATGAQQQGYAAKVAGSDVDETQAVLNHVRASGGAWVGGAPRGAARAWSRASSGTLGKVRGVEKGLVGSISRRTADLHHATLGRAAVVGVITLAVLLAVLAGTLLIARSLVSPLRALRSGALDVADTRLPGLVRRLADEEPEDVDTSVAPIGVRSSDEIGQVARAFDEVHRVAARLAGEQARLRSQTGTLFVNLSRRSQTLVERQLEVIDGLEDSERDPERLRSLFTLDHLATRMRRNGENLLVLGGQEPLRRFSAAMPLHDVLRAAVSEIERYERVDVDTDVPEVLIAETAVTDLVHLLAELLDNATTFSSPEDSVAVRARQAAERGVVVEVADRGLGLSEQGRDAVNAALADPPELDTGVSRRMGLFVVARLARRHGIAVRLEATEPAGLTVVVTLPPGLAGAQAVAPANPNPAAHTPTDDEPVPGRPGSRWISALRAPGLGPESWFGDAPLTAFDPAPTGGSSQRPTQDREPAARGRTAAGLPVREPGANYVPGSLETNRNQRAAAPAETAAGPTRWEQDPEAIRARFSSYQAGSRRGHQAGARPTEPRRGPQPDSAQPRGDILPDPAVPPTAHPSGPPATAPSPPPAPAAPGIRQLPPRDHTEAASAPGEESPGGHTAVGLPVRMPGTSYVPGAAVTARPEPGRAQPAEPRARWEREPSAVGARFAAYQAGLRRGRSGTEAGDDPDAPSEPPESRPGS
jgi:signal transduction histidine kinase